MMDKVIKRIQINKTPGNDLINGYWCKHLTRHQDELSVLFNHQIYESPLLTWLKATHTVLLPKNNDTHVAKNYCPITWLNVLYKLYSSCISQRLMENVYKNNFVTSEQAAGKKKVWGTVKQLLIKKSILKEVRSMQRNPVTVWLDCRKAFDSIPHSWLLHALKLAKLPNHLLTTIKNLTESWYTKVNLNPLVPDAH